MVDSKIETKQDNTPAKMYKNTVDIGTETIGQEDMNTPVLKIIQSNTQDIENKKDGAYYRSDTKEQFDNIEVNLVHVSTIEAENFNKTGKEKVKVYFGFYKDTNEPFKMYVRGWGLATHREFQTQIARIKNINQVPMLSLTIDLTTEKQTGTIQDTGKSYLVYKPIFNIVKDGEAPVVEMNVDRITFLVEAAKRFNELAQTSKNDDEQNSMPKDSEVNPEDVPF